MTSGRSLSQRAAYRATAVHSYQLVSRAVSSRKIGVIDVARVDGVAAVAEFSAVIDPEDAVALSDKVHDELFVAGKACLEHDEDSGKTFKTVGRIISAVDLDSAEPRLPTEDVHIAHDGALALLLREKFLVEGQGVVKIFPECDGC